MYIAASVPLNKHIAAGFDVFKGQDFIYRSGELLLSNDSCE